ncbi:hypothetical protein OH77DRAFT_791134 [Trametes cingulata]|nr:hypothetical protein OH77DRAFT_791134 [Trametes cingulata]
MHRLSFSNLATASPSVAFHLHPTMRSLSFSDSSSSEDHSHNATGSDISGTTLGAVREDESVRSFLPFPTSRPHHPHAHDIYTQHPWTCPPRFRSLSAVTGRLVQHSDSAVPSPSLRSRDGSARGHIFSHSHSQPASRQGGHSQSQSARPPSNNLSPVVHARDAFHTPPSRSPAQSRAASPLRILQGWNLHRNHTRDEPFIPVDPFRSHIRWFGLRRESSPGPGPGRAENGQVEHAPVDAVRVAQVHAKRAPGFFSCLPNLLSLCCLCSNPCASSDADGDENEKGELKPHGRRRGRWRAALSDATLFCTDTLPRQLYLWFLLWLPALYWHRVARVFEDAEVSKPEIQRLIDACGNFAHDPSVDAAIATGFATPVGGGGAGGGGGAYRSPSLAGMPFPEEWTPPIVSPALARFKNSWELFVDSLMREWKTFNVVSALLCTTILTIFQIEDAAADPLTRWSALLSLIFALMSLSYGCVYIVQFGTMRSMDRASRWAEEAQRSRTAIFWNIWVLLATPAVWLAWSMIAFCVAILSFVWRTGAAPDQDADARAPLNAQQALGVRVAISAVFAFGLFHFFMIIRTFGAYSRIAARRDRRGRFRRRPEGDEHGERGRERDRPRGTPYGKYASDSMVGNGSAGGAGLGLGLGLTGMGERGSPGPTGVILENVDLEKGEGVYIPGERVRAMGTLTPKL